MKVRDFPNNNPEESLNIMRGYYKLIKRNHNDIPKLQKRTLQNMNRCKTSSGNGAHCHNSSQGQKMICFKPMFLKKRAGDLNFLGYRDNNGRRIFRVIQDTMAFGEVLTHEIAHFSIKGVHNKRFYERQHKLWATFINSVISGELYK